MSLCLVILLLVPDNTQMEAWHQERTQVRKLEAFIEQIALEVENKVSYMLCAACPPCSLAVQANLLYLGLTGGLHQADRTGSGEQEKEQAVCSMPVYVRCTGKYHVFFARACGRKTLLCWS